MIDIKRMLLEIGLKDGDASDFENIIILKSLIMLSEKIFENIGPDDKKKFVNTFNSKIDVLKEGNEETIKKLFSDLKFNSKINATKEFNNIVYENTTNLILKIKDGLNI